MRHDPIRPHATNSNEQPSPNVELGVQIRTEFEIETAKNEMLLRLLRLHYAGVLEAFRRGHVQLVDTALIPRTTSNRKPVPRWVFKKWQQLSKKITKYLGGTPTKQHPDDFDAGMIFGKLQALLWLGGHPSDHLKNQFRRLQFLGINAPLNIGPNTARNHLDGGRPFVRRTYEEIGAELGELVRAHAHAHARRIEREIGGKHLRPDNDFEWGIVNGRLSALRWSLGDDWDNLNT